MDLPRLTDFSFHHYSNAFHEVGDAQKKEWVLVQWDILMLGMLEEGVH